WMQSDVNSTFGATAGAPCDSTPSPMSRQDKKSLALASQLGSLQPMRGPFRADWRSRGQGRRLAGILPPLPVVGAPGVRPLGASERSRRAEARDLRLSRFHACVCAQPAGAVYDSRPDHAHTPSTQCEGGGAVVPAPSARPGRASGRGAQCQTPGPLPVRRATDELSLSPAVLSARSTALAHVVEPAHARKDARLDSLPTAAPASSVTPAAHLSRLGPHGESCVRNRVRQSRTLGSVR